MGVDFSVFHQICGLSPMVPNYLGPSTAPSLDSGIHICLQGTCTLYSCPWGDPSQPHFPISCRFICQLISPWDESYLSPAPGHPRT